MHKNTILTIKLNNEFNILNLFDLLVCFREGASNNYTSSTIGAERMNEQYV